MKVDEYFIKKTFALAKKGLSFTNPNPLVGAVIVKNRVVLSSGYHHKAGLPHAEIEALNALKEDPKGAVLYVNLEPCCFFGKTPPCADAIIKSGISKVICSTPDPNPQVFGKGMEKLKKSGIEVIAGVLEEEAKLLNEAFFTYHTKNRPFIALKFAISLDGKLATISGGSKWITSQKSRDLARSLRANYQGILVGINTVLQDDPHLGIRKKGLKDPIRIILDNDLKIPLYSQVLRDENVIIVTTKKADQKKLKNLQEKNIQVLIFERNSIPLDQLIRRLYELKIISVLVEGGGEVLGSFIDAGLIDKVYAFIAPMLLGGREAKTIGGQGISKVKDALRLNKVKYKKIEGDLLITGYCFGC